MAASIQKSLETSSEDLQRSFGLAQKQAQYGRYLRVLDRSRLAEQYANGEIAMIFDVTSRREIEVDSTINGDGVGSDFLKSAKLILHRNAIQCPMGDYWKQQFVLIDNVEIVKSAEGIIPSTVRLYLGQEGTKDDRGGDVYVSPFDPVFEFFPRFREGESRVLVNDSGINLLRNNEPSVIQRRSEVVDCISDDQRHFAEQSRSDLGMIYEGFLASCGIYFGRGSVTLSQLQDRTVDVRNMLLGPVNF
jgi:hypothetical protein